MPGRSFLLLICLSCLSVLHAQEDELRVYSIDSRDGAEIRADNPTDHAYSIVLHYELSNMRSVRPENDTIIVPPQAKGFRLSTLERIEHDRWQYRYRFSWCRGDIRKATHDDSYVYALPFDMKDSSFLRQGYNGSFSHLGRKALDLDMPERTTIMAAREGKVIKVKQDSDKNCPNPSCANDGNYITIQHPDGSMANYFHLLKDGSIVKQGESVKKGQPIGLSGNTGFSTRPHLHFEVFLPTLGGLLRSVPTRFATADGVIVLSEKKHYKHPVTGTAL